MYFEENTFFRMKLLELIELVVQRRSCLARQNSDFALQKFVSNFEISCKEKNGATTCTSWWSSLLSLWKYCKEKTGIDRLLQMNRENTDSIYAIKIANRTMQSKIQGALSNRFQLVIEIWNTLIELHNKKPYSAQSYQELKGKTIHDTKRQRFLCQFHKGTT